ncbi:unnamed protein product [Candidula unifasciata]|uniref:TIR domain-containing protein n=1 Tax=Candidula unifasciata TaxID=100452 RepID=A0A8S3ZB75_9EUPU|nr:unnamed protein product [Candidula unifasciata]
MRNRKYSYIGTKQINPVFIAVLLLLLPEPAFSFPMLFRNTMNCSLLCSCEHKPLVSTMQLYNVKHFKIMGNKYRPEIGFFDTNSEYMTFLGTFAPLLHRITEITCTLSDGMSHSVMSLLNGVDQIMDTALSVSCRKNERVVWDVPSWLTSFNIFVAENCLIVPNADRKLIVIPMNTWILDVDNVGDQTLGLLDIRFSMNTLTLAISGSKLSTTPRQWQGIDMVSMAVISLRNNGLEEFNCPFHFTKRLDTLNLDGNKIAHFPECLLRSFRIRLNYLSLANNAISDLAPLYEIPEAWDIPDISVINLSFNQIRSVDAIRNMANLVVLDLSHNHIKYITEDAFDYLTSLEVIYVSHNSIHVIGAQQFKNNYKLSIIDISDNFLPVILPEQLPMDSSSLLLDVRQNKLTYPPYVDCAKGKLNIFNMKIYSSGNPYICDCYMIHFERCQSWISKNSPSQQKDFNVFKDLMDMLCDTPEETKDVALPNISFHSKCYMMEECPETCKCLLLNVQVLVVNCSARRMLDMPDHLPTYPKTTVVLYLDHNPLQILGHRPYLRTLSELYVHNCLLTSVTPAAMASLRDVQVLTLHNNMIQKLPSRTRNITLNQVKNLTLHNNPWACSCDSLWMPQWIARHKSSLWMPGSITCHYLRKPVQDLTELDLNCNSSSYIDTFLAISLTLSSLVSTLVIVICYRSEITVLLYSKLGFPLGCGFSCGDLFNPYDAFISYSQDTYNWVMDTLVPQLENGSKKYRLCLHYRDFPTGDSIVDSLPWSIRMSRVAILVLSKDVMRKEWCILEVRAAFQRMLLAANRLVIVAMDYINTDELPPDMRTYMNTHDYLRYEDPCFWEKLELLLPPKEQRELTESDDAMPRNRSRESFHQSTPDKHEMTGLSDLTDLSFKLSEISEHGDY